MIDANRKRKTENKVNQRKKLAKNLGVNEGCGIIRKKNKLAVSDGYLRDGNVSKNIACGHNYVDTTINGHKMIKGGPKKISTGFYKESPYTIQEKKQIDELNDKLDDYTGENT